MHISLTAPRMEVCRRSHINSQAAQSATPARVQGLQRRPEGRTLKAIKFVSSPSRDYTFGKQGDAQHCLLQWWIAYFSPPKVASPPASLQGQTLVKMYYVYSWARKKKKTKQLGGGGGVEALSVCRMELQALVMESRRGGHKKFYNIGRGGGLSGLLFTCGTLLYRESPQQYQGPTAPWAGSIGRGRAPTTSRASIMWQPANGLLGAQYLFSSCQ